MQRAYWSGLAMAGSLFLAACSGGGGNNPPPPTIDMGVTGPEATADTGTADMAPPEAPADMAVPDMAPPDMGVPDMAATDMAAAADKGAADSSGVDSTPIDMTVPDMFVPDMFVCMPAGGFLSCTGSTATYCNSTGNGTTTFSCATTVAGTTLGCESTTSTGCGQCSGPTCTTSGSTATWTTCDTAHDFINASGTCTTLAAGASSSMCNSAGTGCLQCTGTNVCGDGTSWGTSKDTSYTCTTGGTVDLTTGVSCAFGCDPMNGQCRDMVPANQAGEAASLAGTDPGWSCSVTPSATLPVVSVTMGQTLTINTGSAAAGPSMTIGGTAVPNVQFGGHYTPTGSGTSVVVAHLEGHSLSIDQATVNVTGSYGLILLVDGNVTVTGTSGTPTFIHARATGYTTAGPGANTTTTAGAGSAGKSTSLGGGGGAGYGATGGNGGDGGTTMTGGAGGMVYGSPEILESGAGGGTGAVPTGGTLVAAKPGFGGGALQISACGTISVGANVIVNASGGGGQGGASAPTAGSGGGGAGSGGTILIEAAQVSVAGNLAANGGGGGGGGLPTTGATLNPGGDGGDWVESGPVTTPATGGDNKAVIGTILGGNGGAGTGSLADGQAGATGSASSGGGGGGGAVGTIYLNVSPLQTKVRGVTSSPTPRASFVCVTTNGTAPASCTY